MPYKRHPYKAKELYDKINETKGEGNGDEGEGVEWLTKGNSWAQVQRTSSSFGGKNENNVKDTVHMLPCHGL